MHKPGVAMQSWNDRAVGWRPSIHRGLWASLASGIQAKNMGKKDRKIAILKVLLMNYENLWGV